MDIQILRAIVQSREEVTKDVENPEAFDKSLTDQKFPPTDRKILAELTRSFTDLISYKVSPDAYQRYSVRIQVIEVLRDWIRPPRELESSRTFSQGERVLAFAERILKIYLTNDILLQENLPMDVLVTLANALITLSARNKSFLVYVDRLLHRIAVLEQSEDSQRLLLASLEKKDLLELSSLTVERLYIAQSHKLLEEPLMNNLIENLRDSKDITGSLDLKISYNLEKLLKVTAISPTIFQIASSILKEIFVCSDYSPKALSYIQFFLKSLSSHCLEQNKNILDLYPLRLQSCVPLLNIEPEQHTSISRVYVLKYLEKVHLSSPDETLILISHFPKWLQYLSSHIVNYSTLDESRSVTNMITDD